MATNRLGIFIEALPLDLVRKFAIEAEASGAEHVWFPEITFGDAFIPAAAAAMETKRIRLATGIVGIWSRSPVAMALTAASLSQLCPGRLILGLGLQAKSYVERWHGRPYDKTLKAMREYVTIVRSILAGKNTSLEGEIFRVKNFQLMIPPPDPPIPIYLAAVGPKMNELGGEIADGVLGYFNSIEYLKNVTIPAVERGAERAGRSLVSIEIGCGLPTLVTNDANAFELHKGQVLMFATALGSSKFYAESIAQAGFGDAGRQIRERVARGEMREALEASTHEMVDALTLTGKPDHIRQRMRDYRAAGVTSFVLNPSPPGTYFPLFQGQFPEGTEIPPFSFSDYLRVVDETLAFIASEPSQHAV
jgi:5,10-methylenetetrahydromethanopterin reductase